MTKTIGVCFLLLLGISAYGQEEQVFAFVLNKEGKAGLRPAAGYKYDVTLAVFKDLLRAQGDLRQPAPQLVMNDGEQCMAWMNPVKLHIGIEEKAYDVCTGFGPDSLNALAALLVHELTHYYEKHDWNRNFAHANQGLETSRHLHSMDESVKQETQADYIGGFLAFSAGYNVHNLMPRLLEALYRSYGLPEALPGYPELQERIQVSRNAMNQLLNLQTVYEMARWLSVLENYEDAALYYKHILQNFQSREVYNNAGVNYAMAALSYFGATEMPYTLPFELDLHSRLYNLKGIQADRLKIRQDLLDQALEQFDRAILLDPAYAPGYLNKACLYVLTSEWDDADFWLKKGKKIKDTLYTTDFMVLEAVAAAMQNDSLRAHRLLASAKDKGSILAQINLNVLLQNPQKAPKYAVALSTELIDSKTIEAFLSAPAVDKEISITKTAICGRRTMPNSNIWMHYVNDGKQYAVVQWCGEACTDATLKGARNGVHSDVITETYGSPPRVTAHPEGAIWVYPGYGLIFQLDREGVVKAWGTYRKSG